MSGLDAEGLGAADIEAGSRPDFKRFTSSLSLKERVLLRTYRCEAIRTPTRRHRATEPEQRARLFCAFAGASARNFWQDCCHFNFMRGELETEF